MYSLKYDTNELIYKTDTHTENKFTVTKRERGWGKDNLGVWISRFKLSYINNIVLLYGTGNYI